MKRRLLLIAPFAALVAAACGSPAKEKVPSTEPRADTTGEPPRALDTPGAAVSPAPAQGAQARALPVVHWIHATH